MEILEAICKPTQGPRQESDHESQIRSQARFQMTSNHGSGSGSNDAPVASDPNREGLNASARGSPQEKRPGIVRRLYDWVLSWADTPYGPIALALIAVAEASFFPIPPDVLLIALVLGRPDRYLVLAANSTISSVLGGLAGYAIGVLYPRDRTSILRMSPLCSREQASWITRKTLPSSRRATRDFTALRRSA